jgi:hypothetical protein
VGEEGARQEIEVSREGFTVVEPSASIVTGGVVEDFQEGLLVGVAGQPGVRAGIVLPKRAVIAGLPAFDGLGRLFVARIWGELMFDGPTTDAGAVGFKI